MLLMIEAKFSSNWSVQEIPEKNATPSTCGDADIFSVRP